MRNSKKILLIVGAIALLVVGVGAILPPVRMEVVVLDDLVRSTGRIEVRARLVRGRAAGILRGVSDGRVQFHVDGGDAGRARTDRDGIATLVVPVRGEGTYVIRATGERGEEATTSPAHGVVRVQHHEQRILAVDLDGPLADGSWFEAFLNGSDSIRPIAGAAETLDDLSRLYAIVYVTARDEDLANPTKAWLAANGFPRGPVFFSRSLHDPFQLGRHVPAVIRRLKRTFPRFEFGVGDSGDEARAFLQEGVKAFLYGAEGKAIEGAHRFAAWHNLPGVIDAARTGTN